MSRPNVSPVAANSAQHGVALSYCTRRLGTYDRCIQYQLKHLQGLVDDHDFPPPLPHLRGKQWVTRVTPSSTWTRAHVDAWFDDRLPPKLALVIDNAELEAAAAALDANAAALAGAA